MEKPAPIGLSSQVACRLLKNLPAEKVLVNQWTLFTNRPTALSPQIIGAIADAPGLTLFMSRATMP